MCLPFEDALESLSNRVRRRSAQDISEAPV